MGQHILISSECLWIKRLCFCSFQPLKFLIWLFESLHSVFSLVQVHRMSQMERHRTRGKAQHTGSWVLKSYAPWAASKLSLCGQGILLSRLETDLRPKKKQNKGLPVPPVPRPAPRSQAPLSYLSCPKQGANAGGRPQSFCPSVRGRDGSRPPTQVS